MAFDKENPRKTWNPVGWRKHAVYDWLDTRAAACAEPGEEPEKFEREPDCVIRKPEVIKLVGLGGSSIDRLEAAGEFPQRINLGRGK